MGGESHNPYFNRWFSAISGSEEEIEALTCHNPYFNRWFSAIAEKERAAEERNRSQSLF